MTNSVQDLFSVSGKTVLITGGATGIGRMIAETMVRGGAEVFITSRRADACEQVAAELNQLDSSGQVVGFGSDISSDAGIEALREDLVERCNALHILVNNAGMDWGAPLGRFPHEAWGAVMDVNVTGPFMLTQALLDLLEASASSHDPARIINIGSVSGILPEGQGFYSYAASKAAIHHVTRVLANELASRAITVNAIAPGLFASEMTEFAITDQEQRDKIVAKIPLGRMGGIDDIGALALLLSSRGGAFMTGTVIPLDGGATVRIPEPLFEVTS